MHPAKKLPIQPWMAAAETRAVVAALTARGAEVRFVGGCVRDSIIGRRVTDIDIATHDPPETVLALLRASDIRAIPTGIDHGTITAVTGKAHFEVTTLRRDVETYGRHAKVEYTDDWAADAARRDLTINALFLSPDGIVYDPFGGLDDLEARRVRFVGVAEDRIREDVLRLLRFFRFFAYYGAPPPDAEAMAACRKLKHLLPTLSAERVWSELRKLLLAPEPAAVLDMMEEEGILEHVLAEPRDTGRLAAMTALETDLSEPDPLRRLIALVPAGPHEMTGLAERLKLSNKDKTRLVRAAAERAGFKPLNQVAARARWYYRHAPAGNLLYRDLLLLHRAEEGARPADLAGDRKALAEATSWTSPKFPLGGQDVKALGVPAGPRVGDLLAAVERWWIDGDFKATRRQCLTKLKVVAEEGERS
ncbi:MAG: CCA tRNA nucleotidyltransferase [Alphaproteobacteria bacterium]|nr:CCA tRNA nucleotidyltransferase [Alphaproteobacteria bacterium]